jgi:hypothetical protein
MSAAQTLTRHEAARKAARARWGDPRVIRLDGLTADQRRLVLAMVEMARATDAASDKATQKVA